MGAPSGLFSSRRGPRRPPRRCGSGSSAPVLCQGEDRLPKLVRAFTEDPATSLFGTMSLWQGVDVPGPSCSLVVIDRIPFPRPDDPLMSARARAVDAAGGNGFVTVSAAHAAVRLAQGAGRLIRAAGDRGVVAVLDSRLATARYGGFLRDSLPDFWPTASTPTVVEALRRSAPNGWGVADGAGRGWHARPVATVGFLHTAHAHVRAFRDLLNARDDTVADRHLVDTGLLAAARAHGVGQRPARAGGPVAPAGGGGRGRRRLHLLDGRRPRAKVVGAAMGLRVVRVDRPMAEAAVLAGRRIAVVSSLDEAAATVMPLLRECAQATGRDRGVRPGALPGHLVVLRGR